MAVRFPRDRADPPLPHGSSLTLSATMDSQVSLWLGDIPTMLAWAPVRSRLGGGTDRRLCRRQLVAHDAVDGPGVFDAKWVLVGEEWLLSVAASDGGLHFYAVPDIQPPSFGCQWRVMPRWWQRFEFRRKWRIAHRGCACVGYSVFVWACLFPINPKPSFQIRVQAAVSKKIARSQR